ncbi:hemolysin-coregulated protein [Gammaproteobacteria bacterium 53_120_T64]|nr:hemolysin-coregulated protein [Gammaproteobacteria bacterium 53_120_T64]
MAIYMNYDGLAVKGSVTSKGYEDWIDISSFQFGVGRGISMEVGGMQEREATRPSISEVSLSKAMDAASGGLFQASVAGSEGVKVLIHIVRTGAKEVQTYATYELEQCLVSSYSVSADGGGSPHESVSLSFAKIMLDLSNVDGSGVNATSMKVGYDLAMGTPL